MSIDEQIEVVAAYFEWVTRQPFGIPIDTEAYRRHLDSEGRLAELEAENAELRTKLGESAL